MVVIEASSAYRLQQMYIDHADGAHAVAEDRHLKQLSFCNELVLRKDLGECGHVEPADVIRCEDVRLVAFHVGEPVHANLDSGGPKNDGRPPARRLVEQT